MYLRVNRRSSRVNRSTAVIGAALLACGSPLLSDESAPGEESATVAEARKVVEAMEVQRLDDGEGVVSGLIPKPLLRFGDLTRGHVDGTVWAWGEKGRPALLVESFRFSAEAPLVHVAQSLSREPLDVRDRGFHWTPDGAELDFRAVPDSGTPSDDAKERLRQMKAVAERFSAHEFWDGRTELRLLVQPVHRYSDADAGLIDGAIFVLAHENNPEVVVLLEAQRLRGGKPSWRYALARLSHAHLHVSLDDAEVWDSPTPGDIDETSRYIVYSRPAM